MDRFETDCTDQDHVVRPDSSSRALVAETPSDAGPRIRGRRPMAGFLTQLIVSADPALRPARLERTKAATALYARNAAFAKRA
ncbi:hypothetical protein BV511_16225 [Methylorubrum extorquens]|nr:hypothetical protein BV511_16225 [Methylorubrum extorquens]